MSQGLARTSALTATAARVECAYDANGAGCECCSTTGGKRLRPLVCIFTSGIQTTGFEPIALYDCEQLGFLYYFRMREKTGGMSKYHPGRSRVARQVRIFREGERLRSFIVNRNGREYLRELYGVKALFNYVRTLACNKVLDVGAGTTLGIHEIARSRLGEGMQFTATVLRYVKAIAENLGKEATFVTTVESLRGIPDGSIGCVIAVYSLAYSNSPEAAIKSIDRVLVPGGALKATFADDRSPPTQPGDMQTMHPFVRVLESLHYDVEAYWAGGDHSVVVAIKSGTPHPKAEDLLWKDMLEKDQQMEMLPKY